jgi:phage FluMu gp28-like protein
MDADWIEDNRAFKMISGVAKLPDGKTESSGGQRHGDAGVAGAMVIYATRQEGGAQIEYTEAPRAGAGWNGSPSDDEENDYAEAGGGAW